MALTEFTVKEPFPASTPTSTSPLRILKALLHAYVFQHVSHLLRALANAKSMASQLLTKKTSNTCSSELRRTSSKKKKKRANVFSSIHKLHQQLKWSPSSYKHHIPMAKRSLPTQFITNSFVSSNAYFYDSTWDSVVFRDDNADEIVEPSDQFLSGYLSWLEEETDDQCREDEEDSKHENEIDMLAEKFIEKCYEKFRLEKQESYRRYQEMLARSI